MPPRPDVSAERRRQIIEAALACFTRKGYTNTTMDDIVAESGLSKGSLYWYFKSKDDLFIAMVTSMFENVAAESMESLVSSETAVERLRAGAQSMTELGKQIEGVFYLLAEFWARSEHRQEAGGFWVGMLREYAQVIEALLADGVQRGEFRSVDVEALTWMLLAAYDGLAAYQMLMPDLDVAHISEVFVETLLKGLAVDGERE